MSSRTFINISIPIAAAARLASLGGISNDLGGVLDYCKYLGENDTVETLNFIVWEGLSSAAVVRYVRCFGHGVREPLPADFFAFAPESIADAHKYFIAVRNKHVAHSVNDFEENDVVAQVGTHFTSSAEIESIHPNHGRLIGLAFGDPHRLAELAHWARAKVYELMAEETTRLLPVVRAIPLEDIRKFGVAELGSGGNREKVSARRKRP